MSIRLMNRVYEKAVDATTQRVLLVLCDYANDHGYCWPSIPLMAWKIGVSERTVMRNVSRLEETGVIVVHRQVGAVNRYEIDLEALPDKPAPPTKRHPRQNDTPVTGDTPPPTKCHPTRDTAMSPEPSRTINEPPEETAPKQSAKQTPKASRLPSTFTVTDEMRAWAHEAGAPDALIQRETDKFRDYWSAVSGQRGTKLDWTATWRNWLRKAIDEAPKGSLRIMTGGQPSRPVIEIPDHLFGQARLEYARQKQAEIEREQEWRHA